MTPRPHSPRRPTVLVIDDSEPDVEWCEIILGKTRRFGEILSCPTAEAGLELFRRYDASRAAHPEAFPPTLILLDINMPRMNGFEFLDAFATLKADFATRGVELPTVILMVTSSSDAADRARAEATGLVADFVTKPLSESRALQIAERFATAG